MPTNISIKAGNHCVELTPQEMNILWAALKFADLSGFQERSLKASERRVFDRLWDKIENESGPY